MTEPSVGSVSVDVVPSAETFWRDFKTKTQPGARRAGDDLGDALGPPIASSVRDAVERGLTQSGPAVKQQGKSQGADYGDAFDREVVARLESALKNLPDAQIDANLKPAEAKLAELRATLVGLTDQAYLDLGVDDKTTLATISTLRAELEELTKPEHDIRVRVNAGAAAVELEALQLKLDKLSFTAGGGAEGDLAGIGAGAARAGAGIYQYLIPALGAALLAVGPVVAVGSAGLGTILLGAKGLKDEVVTGLSPAFADLEEHATAALGPGISKAVDNLQRALPQLDPLLQTFGSEIGDIAVDFTHWLDNGGIKSFVAYAETELPVIERLAKSAAGAVGSIFARTQGPANDLADSASGLLSDIDALIKLSDKIPKVKTDDGGVKGFFEGIGAALTGNPSGALHSGTILGRGLTNGLEALLPSGSVSPSGLVSAAQGKATAAGQSAAVAHTQSADAAAAAAVAQLNAQAFGTTADAYKTAATASASFATQTAASTLAMQLENNAAGLLSQALQGLGGDSLGVAEANTQFQTGLLTLKETLDKNNESVEGNSAAALANQAALQQQVAAAQQVYQATVQQTGSTEQGKAAYDAAIQSIEKATGATGKNKDAIDAYINKISEIPPVKPTKIDVDTVAATAAIDALNAKITNFAKADGVSVSAEATLQSHTRGYASGGLVADGLFMVGENGVEYGYKSGSDVQIFNQAQIPQMPATSPQVAYVTVQSVLDGKVVAQSTNEVNLANGRRN